MACDFPNVSSSRSASEFSHSLEDFRQTRLPLATQGLTVAVKYDRNWPRKTPYRLWLRAQIFAAFGEPPDRHFEYRVRAKCITIIAVGITRGDQQSAVTDHLGQPTSYPVLARLPEGVLYTKPGGSSPQPGWDPSMSLSFKTCSDPPVAASAGMVGRGPPSRLALLMRK